MNSMKDFLFAIDTFGTSPTFLIKGNLQLTTILGGFLSLCIYIATIVSLIYFSLEIFYKESPSVAISEIEVAEPNPLKYPDEFFFMFRLSNQYGGNLNNLTYILQGMIVQNYDKYELNLTTCDNVITPDHKYYELIKSYHYEIELKNFFCIDPNSDYLQENYMLQGTNQNNDENFRSLLIELDFCDKDTLGELTCPYDSSELSTILYRSTIDIVTISTNVDTTNYQNPLQYKLDKTTTDLAVENDMVEYKLKSINIIDDDGLLFPTEKVKSANAIKEARIYNSGDAAMMRFSFELVNYQQNYARKYYKLQDLASEVGGIYGSLTMIGMLVMSFYSDISYFENLVNSFFDIRENYKPPTIKANMKTSIILPRDLNNESAHLNLFKNRKDKKLNFLGASPGVDLADNYIKSKQVEDDNKQSYFDEVRSINTNKTGKRGTAKNIFIKSKTRIYGNENCGTNKKVRFSTIDKKDDDIEIENKKINSEDNLNNLLKVKKKFNISSSKTKLKIGFFEKLLFLNVFENCYRRKKGFSKNKLFYKGKEFLENLLDISGFMKHFYYQKMYVDYGMDDEQKNLFKKVSRPILAEKYIGPLYEQKNLPTFYKQKLAITRSKSAYDFKVDFDKEINYGEEENITDDVDKDFNKSQDEEDKDKDKESESSKMDSGKLSINSDQYNVMTNKRRSTLKNTLILSANKLE